MGDIISVVLAAFSAEFDHFLRQMPKLAICGAWMRRYFSGVAVISVRGKSFCASRGKQVRHYFRGGRHNFRGQRHDLLGGHNFRGGRHNFRGGIFLWGA